MYEFLHYEYFNNTVLDYLLFLTSLIISCLGIRIIGYFLIKHFIVLAEKTKTSIDDLLVLRVKKYLIPILYFAAFYFNIKILYLNDFLTKVIDMLIFAFITVILTMFVSSAAVFFFNKYLDNKLKGSSSKLTLKWINGITKTLIWGIALILFFDNIGFKINFFKLINI